MKILKLIVISFFIFSISLARAENILLIGDSLSCGSFGKHMVENLSAGGHHVTLYCAVSSAPINWLKGKNPPGQICQTMTSDHPRLAPCGDNGQMPQLSSLLAKYKGSRVIVSLGTNSLLSPSTDQSYNLMAQAVKETSSRCEWIGPPHLHPSQAKGFPKGRIETEEGNLNSFYDSLAKSVAGACSLFDSRSSTAAGMPGNETVDGVHRNESAGKFWADHISKAPSGSATESSSVHTAH